MFNKKTSSPVDTDGFVFMSVIRKNGYYLMHEKSYEEFIYKTNREGYLVERNPNFLLQIESKGVEIVPYGKKYLKFTFIFNQK